MACFHPLQGWRSRSGAGIVFNRRDGYEDRPVTVPCGQCIGCRLERSRQWAIRCMHEASLYDDNCFITLTFSSEYLPSNLSVDVRDWQLFMKRLKSSVRRKSGKTRADGIRFFHCGEYGELSGRPHYHACLFNYDFQDKTLWKRERDQSLYRSASLEALWPYGHCSIGSVTFESAAYVARYIMKKVTGPAAEAHYQGRKPEYTTMSRNPGIGRGWFDKWNGEVYRDDFCIVRGRPMKPPRFYDLCYQRAQPEHADFFKEPSNNYEVLKAKRVRGAKKFAANNTRDRLKVREKVQQARLKMLPRKLEE